MPVHNGFGPVLPKYGSSHAKLSRGRVELDFDMHNRPNVLPPGMPPECKNIKVSIPENDVVVITFTCNASAEQLAALGVSVG